ncbi:Membrane coat complex Retromer, subunit VPS5/SNX1, Sorting nexins, and related PX domain-containing proteins [Ceraceosorus bombacis]|uniref:Membrane coat complex Retromer, subunit VPS5/SNX1, Sorting nexins, and related PX domain-containing proteins n=1 Tax=Ceraceosorus bombacis TaxID=401625 RepID=A0A0P1BIK0_9BASI|nr:Membrane coat complex Retromer, subunit VPS5/SNX1, Sorting nexins, and related PX domain-containing proteins [Ceraceosorus bombacis]
MTATPDLSSADTSLQSEDSSAAPGEQRAEYLDKADALTRPPPSRQPSHLDGLESPSEASERQALDAVANAVVAPLQVDLSARPTTPFNFKDIGIERQPQLISAGDEGDSDSYQRVGVGHPRIHSIQPSLVDDESIRGTGDSDEEGEGDGTVSAAGILSIDDKWLESRIEQRRREEFEDQSAHPLASGTSAAGPQAEGTQSGSLPDQGPAAPADMTSPLTRSGFQLRLPQGVIAAARQGHVRKVSVPGAFLTDEDGTDSSSNASPVIDAPLGDAPLTPGAKTQRHQRDATVFADAHSRQTSRASVQSENTNGGPEISGERVATKLPLKPPGHWAGAEDEDAPTPRGHAVQKTSYFEAQDTHSRDASTSKHPGVDGSAQSQVTAPPIFRNVEAPKHTWLRHTELGAPHLGCFMRTLVERQMKFELARSWLLTSIAAPSEPAALGKDDLAIFKRSPNDINLPRPRLPILHFLLARVLSTCPLLVDPVAPRGTAASSEVAEGFMSSAVVPLLRARQSMSLSHAVDRHGEGMGTEFDARSTLDEVQGVLTRGIAAYVTSLLGASLAREGLKMTQVPLPTEHNSLMPLSAYYAHRASMPKLKQGGYEVDIVSLRAHSATECEFVIAIRRFGFPVSYVIRSEDDFFEYARGLAAELGPKARVRPLPSRPIAGADGGEYSGSLGPLTGNAALAGSQNGRRDSMSSLRSLVTSGFRPSQANEASQSVLSVQTNKNPGAANGAAPASPLSPRMHRYGGGVPPRPSFSRTRSTESARPGSIHPAQDTQSAHGHTPQASGTTGRNTSQVSLAGSERGLPRGRSQVNVASPPIKDPALPLSPSAAEGFVQLDNSSKAMMGTTSSKGGDGRGRSRLFSKRSSSRGPSPSGLRYKEAGGVPRDKSARKAAAEGEYLAPSAHHEARRQHLRSWLRDALAVRGAGHCSETRQFLVTGSFSDKELRTGTRADLEMRHRLDEESRGEREAVAAGSAEEVIELQDEQDALWRSCTTQQGFLDAFGALRNSPTFSELPLPYQRLASWANLKLAHVLYGIFVSGSESSKNLIRAQDLFNAIPWRGLSFAMRDPTGVMLQRVRAALQGQDFLDRLLAVLLEDGGGKGGMQLELDDLRRRFGSPVYRKIEAFVSYTDAKKRLIRSSAESARIPLVAAIARGSDAPRLTEEGVKRIVRATRAWQDFHATLPNAKDIQRELKASVDVRLIADMQRALRLLSLRRDAEEIRIALEKPEIRDIFSALFEPFGTALRRLHKSSAKMADAVADTKEFLARLLDIVSGLRSRVQDPWRSISTIATLLDDAVPGWYAFLHSTVTLPEGSNGSSLTEDIFVWLHHLARLAGSGCDDIIAAWAPPSRPASMVHESEGSKLPPPAPLSGPSVLDASARGDITELEAAARRKKQAEFVEACRWAAGDVDEAQPVQVFGAAGKTRTEAIFADPIKPAPPTPHLDRFRPAFRDALARVLR